MPDATSYDQTNAVWFGAGYSYAANQITFNTAAHATPCLTELDATEAATGSGSDFREVVRAILERINTSWNDTTVVGASYEYRPLKMAFRKVSSLDSSLNATTTFSISFTQAATLGSTVAE